MVAVNNSRPPQSEKHARARIAAGFDAATHAVITGGEVVCPVCRVETDLLMHCADKRCPGPAIFRVQAEAEERKRSQRLWNEYNTREINQPPVRGSLRCRTMDEAAAWRDGWRAAMACAVLVAETARAPAAVDLLREQLEPPV